MFDNCYYKFLLDADTNWEMFDAVVDYPDGQLEKAPEDRYQWRGTKDGKVVSSSFELP